MTLTISLALLMLDFHASISTYIWHWTLPAEEPTCLPTMPHKGSSVHSGMGSSICQAIWCFIAQHSLIPCEGSGALANLTPLCQNIQVSIKTLKQHPRVQPTVLHGSDLLPSVSYQAWRNWYLRTWIAYCCWSSSAWSNSLCQQYKYIMLWQSFSLSFLI